jgi:asparagine synthase (glutamine-hydrolysing)
MCGICGKIYFNQSYSAEPEILTRMCHTISHRGPDDHGLYLQGPVGLGSTRLSIIDVSGGHMPLSNEDGTIWIAYNGEVYNFPHLRERLERAGHHFVTHSDTETIVHLYEEEGDDFVRFLNGMFAFALWDDRRKRLILARDQLGIKPLYYAQLADRLLFGSEIKTILADGLDRQVDPLALHDYLSLNYVPGPRTMFTQICKLLPGHILIYEASSRQIRLERFWDLPQSEPATEGRQSPAETENKLLDLLRQVVHDQMISDVPLGAFLSGGLDSSVVVALMSEVSTQPVKTFSIGFQEQSYNELPYARIVAERFKTDHHELIMEPQAHEVIKAIAQYFDEPFADSSAVAMYAISQLAAKHVKVALSGDGGDELFGGYYTYQADKLAAFYRRLPKTIGAGLIPKLVNLIPASDQKVSLDFKLKRFVNGGSLPPLPAHVAWKAFLSEEMKVQLYSTSNGYHQERTSLRPTVELMQKYFDNYPGDDMLNRLLYVDMKVQLVDDMLTKVDRMSMAHSLEVRVPLLDLRLVEFMTPLPSYLKVHNLTLKYLFKRIGQRLLPAEILKRPKAGLHVPIPRWIKTDLRDMVSRYLSVEAITEQGFFNPVTVNQMIEAHLQSRHDYSRNIWNLLVFSLWYEHYMN